MSANEKHAAAYHDLSDDTVRGRYCDGTYMQTGRTTDGEEYDAWLAQIRAEAKAEAWEEGYGSGKTDTYDRPYGEPTPNPYK